MKYIKKLNIDFDQWDKLPNQGWHNMKFVEGKTIDYYKKMYPEGTKVRIRKDSIYYNRTLNNPKDVIGYINSNKYKEYYFIDNLFKFDYIFYVNWSNGLSNSYRITDLEYYKE
jgi:hypothetical protein